MRGEPPSTGANRVKGIRPAGRLCSGKGAWGFALPLLVQLSFGAAAQAQQALALEPHDSDHYSETFTFVADLDDGTYVQVQLGVTNIGPGYGTGMCRALVKAPKADAWTKSERFARDRVRYRVDGAEERLEVGTCSVQAGAQVSVEAALAGRRVALQYPTGLDVREPPASSVRIGERSYRSWILFAFAPVQATLELPGSAPRPERGGGFADHSRSTITPQELASRWVRFRALRGPGRVLLLQRLARDGKIEPAWIWREGASFEELSSLSAEAAGKPPSRRWSATLRSASGSAGTLVSKELLFRHAPLRELGALGWIAKSVVEAPVTYTFRATLALAGAEPVDGLMEVTLFE